MDILVIGGTKFVGRHLTDAALERGHRVTHFNRGLSAPRALDGVESIRGDRASDIHRLAKRRWDAVVDTCGFTPDVVERSTRYLADRVDRYVFFSSVSVYDHERTKQPSEDSPVLLLPAGVDRSVFTLENYGALKALCEAIVISTFRHRATVLRPALIAGPYDPTDRFTYWPLRIYSGGVLLAPLRSHGTQYVDSRDLAAFALRTIEKGIGGTYNCATAPGSTTFGDLLDACERAAGSRIDVKYASDEFLERHGVEPWVEMPLWIPHSSDYTAIVNAGTKRACVQGFETRPVFQTVRDTLGWSQGEGKVYETLKAGIAPERERGLTRQTV